MIVLLQTSIFLTNKKLNNTSHVFRHLYIALLSNLQSSIMRRESVAIYCREHYINVYSGHIMRGTCRGDIKYNTVLHTNRTLRLPRSPRPERDEYLNILHARKHAKRTKFALRNNINDGYDEYIDQRYK